MLCIQSSTNTPIEYMGTAPTPSASLLYTSSPDISKTPSISTRTAQCLRINRLRPRYRGFRVIAGVCDTVAGVEDWNLGERRRGKCQPLAKRHPAYGCFLENWAPAPVPPKSRVDGLLTTASGRAM